MACITVRDSEDEKLLWHYRVNLHGMIEQRKKERECGEEKKHLRLEGYVNEKNKNRNYIIISRMTNNNNNNNATQHSRAPQSNEIKALLLPLTYIAKTILYFLQELACCKEQLETTENK